ncbi:amidohydrolase family protein [Mycobacterium avium]|uniref:amidohydrolase family protein n=1 Tax=Mycobacterium avium TaxID=1764 RepID=UPI001CC7D697|nr:amidohydrolase family protein [Mycobacterium avium]
MPDITTAITNTRVLTPDGRLSAPRTVLLRGGLIVESGVPTHVVDARGNTLLPGLIDAHLHLFQGRADLDALTDWGVTTGLDMGLWPTTQVDKLRSAQGVADIRSATIPAVGPESLAARQPGFPREGIIPTPEHARAFVRQRIAEGADYIKIIAEATSPAGVDLKSATAIVDAAHDAGKHVVAHAVTVGAFHVALQAGVDIITHAPLNGRLDDHAIARMLQNHVVSVPTLTMMQHMAGDARYRSQPNPGWSYQNAHNTVAALHAAHVTILVGTDAHRTSDGPATLKPGQSIHHEMELLTRAGLSAADVLRGATQRSAQVFNLADRGEVAVGKRADLLLIDGDPLDDIGATRNITGVWIAGRQVR